MRVVMVGSQQGASELAAGMLHELGHVVLVRTLDLERCCEFVLAHRPDLVLVDFDGNAPALLRAAEEMYVVGNVPLLLVQTCAFDRALVDTAVQAGVSGLVVLPVPLSTFEAALALALGKHAEIARSTLAQRRLFTIAQRAAIGLVATDASGQITFVNACAVRLLQQSAGELMGRALSTVLIHLRDRPDDGVVAVPSAGGVPLTVYRREATAEVAGADVVWTLLPSDVRCAKA